MAVLSVHELPQTGSDDNDGSISAVRTFRVETDSKYDTWQTVRASSLLPRPADAYPGTSSLVVLSRSGQQNESRRESWTVTVNYGIRKNEDGTPSEGGSVTSSFENPEYSVSSETIYEYRNVDLDGRPIKNSANELFVPPLEFPVNIGVYTIVRYMTTYDTAQAQSYRNRVNSSPFTINGVTGSTFSFFSGTALLTKYDGSRHYSADFGGYYWQVTFEIKEHPDKNGWRKKLLDQGFMEKDESNPAAGGGSQAPNKPIVGKNGLPLNVPVLLDGNGKPLPAGGEPHFVPDGLGFKIYEEKDFSVLPLSTTTGAPVTVPDFFNP